jgi:hypothetical protein
MLLSNIGAAKSPVALVTFKYRFFVNIVQKRQAEDGEELCGPSLKRIALECGRLDGPSPANSNCSSVVEILEGRKSHVAAVF